MMPTLTRLASAEGALGGTASVIGDSFGIWDLELSHLSPPGPELDTNEADKTAEDNLIEASRATGNFGIARHFGPQEQAGVVELGDDEEHPLRNAIGGLGGHGGDGNDLALEAGIEVGARFEPDGLADLDVRNFFFGHRDFSIHRLHRMDFGDQVAFLDRCAHLLFQPM